MSAIEFIYSIGILPKDKDAFVLTKEHLQEKSSCFEKFTEFSAGFMYMAVLENHTRKYVINMPNYNSMTVQKGVIPTIRGTDILRVSSKEDLLTLDTLLDKKE